MSSIIGHTLAGLSSQLYSKQSHFNKYNGLWAGWLIILAIAPDFDYIFPSLHPDAHEGMRITHSIFACLLLPISTAFVLLAFGYRGNQLWLLSASAGLAGFSHIVLDTLVAVRALPLLWPFSEQIFKLPFGILPSAGAIFLSNYYFYYNLLIELGVLLPLFFLFRLIPSIRNSRGKMVVSLSLLLLAISIYFMQWAYTLAR